MKVVLLFFFHCSLQRMLAAVQKNATRGDPRSVVKAIDQFCRQKEWAMNVGDEKGSDFLFYNRCILDSVVTEVNPATVLELGTYCGYSTVRIASLLPSNAKLITLEFNPDYAAIARQVIAWAGLEDKECGLLRKGSILLADNVICPGTPDYLEYIRNSPRYKSQYFKSHLEYTKVEDGLEKSVFLG
ncbi:hypothetical protein XENOCAPTIV_023892 [Xenoophorus captivus]|uniref:catechol O-methyltransferase n=2 Tax=Goodeidae TaxID=28758 RepID=A0ABV0RSV4_9TELE